jgi:hypothetical protein
MPKLNDLFAEPTKIEVPINGATVTVRADLDRVTPRFRSDIAGIKHRAGKADAEDADLADFVIPYLETIMVSWDVENDEGVIPINHYALCRVPYVVLAAVFKAIQEALLPNENGGETSNGSFSE